MLQAKSRQNNCNGERCRRGGGRNGNNNDKNRGAAVRQDPGRCLVLSTRGRAFLPGAFLGSSFCFFFFLATACFLRGFPLGFCCWLLPLAFWLICELCPRVAFWLSCSAAPLLLVVLLAVLSAFQFAVMQAWPCAWPEAFDF